MLFCLAPNCRKLPDWLKLPDCGIQPDSSDCPIAAGIARLPGQGSHCPIALHDVRLPDCWARCCVHLARLPDCGTGSNPEPDCTRRPISPIARLIPRRLLDPAPLGVMAEADFDPTPLGVMYNIPIPMPMPIPIPIPIPNLSDLAGGARDSLEPG